MSEQQGDMFVHVGWLRSGYGSGGRFRARPSVAISYPERVWRAPFSARLPSSHDFGTICLAVPTKVSFALTLSAQKLWANREFRFWNVALNAVVSPR